MSKSYIAIIIAVVILAGVGAVLFSRGGNMPSASTNSNPTMAVEKTAVNLITYSDSGFSPQNITVKLGDTVMFKNDSSRNMWVASAPHPVHTDYPAFDAKKTYANGETYSFTFDKVGTWKFHNHMNPTDFGSVTVQ